MIARSWDGLTKAEQADAYADYLERTGVKELAATQGNRGVYVLRRLEGDAARFRVLSLWESMEGIRRFAGGDPERARYYPEDRRFLKELDPHVSHFEVVAQAGANVGSAQSAALVRELETLVEGNNWHGPTLRELLDGVSAEEAASRPIPGGHTIWELVLHVTAWTDVFRRRLEGTAVEAPEAGEFPVPGPPTGRAWAEATRALFESHAALTACVSRLSDAELAAAVPGRPFDRQFQVRAAIRHSVYHSGQIGLLRKG